jgi:hypothetical protein
MTVVRSLDLIHPRARMKFRELERQLISAFRAGKTSSDFRVFETYRSPMRQQAIYEESSGHTGAQAYESAHQYGLAVDYVPFNGGVWSWDQKHDWDFLRAAARGLGLKNDLSWDRPHVEHPVWEDVKKVLRF